MNIRVVSVKGKGGFFVFNACSSPDALARSSLLPPPVCIRVLRRAEVLALPEHVKHQPAVAMGANAVRVPRSVWESTAKTGPVIPQLSSVREMAQRGRRVAKAVVKHTAWNPTALESFV